MHTIDVDFIIILATAFVLGAAVTVFCFRLKKWNDEKNKDKEDDQ